MKRTGERGAEVGREWPGGNWDQITGWSADKKWERKLGHEGGHDDVLTGGRVTSV
jgi:hypothetical protein